MSLLISQSVSTVVQSCLTLRNPVDCSTPGFLVYHHLLDLAHTHVHQVSDAILTFILWGPLLLLPSIFTSTRDFSKESVPRIRWPKYWSFQLQNPSDEYSGLISFRMDWLDLLAVQGTQEYSPQFKSINSSALSSLYSPTLTFILDHWKNHSLD